jgi:hypothetical protein
VATTQHSQAFEREGAISSDVIFAIPHFTAVKKSRQGNTICLVGDRAFRGLLGSSPLSVPTAQRVEGHVWRTKAKPLAFSLADGFAVCGFRAALARYLGVCKRHRLTSVGVGPKIHELLTLAYTSKLRRLAGHLASLFYLARFCEQLRHSIQDQQKQIRGQHNRRHARHRKH